MAILPYLIMIPLAAAFMTPLFAKRMKAAADTIACAATFSALMVSLNVAIFVAGHKSASYSIGNWPAPFGIELSVDGLSAFMLIIANLIGFVIALYSTGYIKTYTDKWKYYTLLMLMIAGVNGLLATGDIFNLYVF
jgi:multicomponent Na+:H+ antiporter subunit D